MFARTAPDGGGVLGAPDQQGRPQELLAHRRIRHAAGGSRCICRRRGSVSVVLRLRIVLCPSASSLLLPLVRVAVNSIWAARLLCFSNLPSFDSICGTRRCWDRRSLGRNLPLRFVALLLSLPALQLCLSLRRVVADPRLCYLTGRNARNRLHDHFHHCPSPSFPRSVIWLSFTLAPR